MIKFKLILESILGKKEQVDPERYFMTLTCFTAFIFLIIVSFFHLIMELKLAPVYIAGGSSIILLCFYFLLRFGHWLFLVKLGVNFLGLFLLDLAWYYNYLSVGPILFFIFAFGSLVLWIWEGKLLAMMLFIYTINIAILFAIDYNASDILSKYPDAKTRIIDIYLSFFLYSSLMFFILSIIKKDFVRQKEIAIKSDNLKSAFLGNMSHEIRTPMNSIVGFSELIENETDNSKRLEYLNIIRNSSSGLLKLLNDLIDLSKIESGELHLNYSNFHIRELFMEMKDIYTLELLRREKHDVRFNYLLPDGDFVIHSDSHRLKQILYNLLNNAMKFTSLGTITLGCQKTGGELIFNVSDTGIGIPEEDQKRIFERLIKFNYQGMNPDGTGIGLSVVEKLVGMLNGRLWLKSVLGEGTSFFISLPYTPATIISNPFKASPKITLANKSESKKIILVAEDDNSSFILIREILRTLNFEIHHVSNGQDAIHFLTMYPETHLILMDLRLPIIDGYEATATIRKTYPNIPIIAQTAFAMLGDREKAINAGCNDYITKPIDANKLQELIQTHLFNQK